MKQKEILTTDNRGRKMTYLDYANTTEGMDIVAWTFEGAVYSLGGIDEAVKEYVLNGGYNDEPQPIFKWEENQDELLDMMEY